MGKRQGLVKLGILPAVGMIAIAAAPAASYMSTRLASAGAPAAAAPSPVATANAVYARVAASSQSPALASPKQASTATYGTDDRLPFRVGFDKEIADPAASETVGDDQGVHLGGFGLGPTRATIGPYIDGDGTTEHIYSRAMAISNRKGQTMILAMIENQGTFIAYKQGPYGLLDMREKVAADLHVPVENIVVNSDHSHAGIDMIGLWGGVPVDYMQKLYNVTVAAMEKAYRKRVPANLYSGSDIPAMPSPTVGGYVPGTATPGEFLVHSQFGADTLTGYDDSKVDTELRVLQARDEDGENLGTFINYAAHATVMGSSNLKYAADWPGQVARYTEAALNEPVALTMVADVGRSQPPRPISDAKCGQTGHISCEVDKNDTYARLLTPWVVNAAAASTPVNGDTITAQETFTREEGVNGALLGVSYSGESPARGYGAFRSVTPPFLTGSVIGTLASAHRLGDILMVASPGEAYPDIRFGVMQSITGASKVYTFGLADDQLGYLIAPASEYPWITASNPGNDNSFFNVSPQYGDHLMCSQAAAAEALGFKASGTATPYVSTGQVAQPNCAALTASDVVPMGPTPQQPWPFGDGTVIPPTPPSPPAVP